MVAAVGDFIGEVKVLLIGLVWESTGPRQSASCYDNEGICNWLLWRKQQRGTGLDKQGVWCMEQRGTGLDQQGVWCMEHREIYRRINDFGVHELGAWSEHSRGLW